MLSVCSIILALLHLIRSQIYIPTSEECVNYYSDKNLPEECQSNDTSCSFSEGLQILKQQQQYDKQFLVCLDLPDYDITVELNSTGKIQDISSLFINGKSLVFQQGYQLDARSGLYLIANSSDNSSITIEKCAFRSYKVWVFSQEIIMNESSFLNQSLLETDCSCVNQGPCDQWKFKYPSMFEHDSKTSHRFNFSNLSAQLTYQQSPPNSITLAAQTNLLLTSSNITFSIIGIFSETFQLDNSTLDTSDLGFPSGYGQGCGYFDQVLHQLLNCMGTGGSHGGFGGNSYPDNCYLLMSKQPYGSIQYPFAPGSGGGFFIPKSKESSSGGGIINIQCSNIFLNNSVIDAQGKNGAQGGGGGAGGAISLQYHNLEALNSKISTDGGDGEKSSSGSGGRIRMFNFNWRTQVQNLNSQGLEVTANGGVKCPRRLSCGQNGSIFTSPCRPGFQLSKKSYLCQQCNPGYYQLAYGYSYCIPCSQKPKNSHFSKNNSNPLNYRIACSYECDQGFSDYEGWSCISESEKALAKMGGENMMISFCLIAGAIMIFCLTLIFRKLSQTQPFSNADSHLTENLLEKGYFRMEDIPFHELRLYIDGTNDPFDPWKVDEEVENSFYSELKNPITKINNILARAIKEINIISKYSKFEKTILVTFKYAYYPLSKLILGVIRRKKAKAIFTTINKLNKKIPDFENLEIKFNIKPHMTVCSLEIFNYTKSVLDFCIQNYYPLFFMLEKAPFKGYSIDFTDPFLKVFLNEISSRDIVEGKNLETFFIEMNKYLKDSNKFFPLISHLFSIKNMFPHLQAYLWQPPDSIIGVNKLYTINHNKPLFLVISSQNINNRHFISSDNLPCIHFTDIQCLKNKFTIRKQLGIEDEKSSFWIIQNRFSMKTLLTILGFLTVVALLISIASLFMVIYVGRVSTMFIFGVITYFILWPLSDFAVSIYNFRTIFTKNQYRLADAIQFNILAIIKTLILFILALIASFNEQSNEIETILYLWLTMFIINILVLIIQIMLRVHII